MRKTSSQNKDARRVLVNTVKSIETKKENQEKNKI